MYKAHLVSGRPVLKRYVSKQSIAADLTMPEIVAVKTLKGWMMYDASDFDS